MSSARPVVAMAVQLLPLSVEYCQAPCDAVAALAVMAMPTRLSPSTSENEEENRLATVSPTGSVLSSEMAARDGLPLVTGASLTAVTVMVEVTAEESVSPSFTSQEMVRSAVLGLSEVLL